MAKQRILPQFIIDTSRTHGLGPCDFIYCSDKDNGFVARVDILNKGQYEELTPNNIDSRLEIAPHGGLACLLTIVRLTGSAPSDTQLRALLKKSAELYIARTQRTVDASNYQPADYIAFLDALLKQSNEQLAAAGSNFDVRHHYTKVTSLLQSAIQYIKDTE